jgi:uncharacterized protein (DUF1800 family)
MQRLRRIRHLAAAAILLLATPFAAAQDAIFANSFDNQAEGPFTRAEAQRFLGQATFGPTLAEIDRLLAMGYTAWLDEQFAATTSRQLPFLDQLIQADINAGRPIEVWQDKRQEIWWRNALTGPDQLRQRVAYALSQILVVSDQNGALEGNPTTLAHWHDMLAAGAFGSYRTLLENVTLHPSMGHYLSMFGNRKPDAALNIRPDENYAREIMQLFSVGLVMLNANGTPIDGNASVAGVQTVPTYNQDTIRGFAQVFTGWKYSTCTPPNATSADPGSLNYWDWDYCDSRASSAPANQDWRLHAGWRTPLQPWGEGNTVRGEVYYAHEGSKQLLVYPGVTLANGVLPSSSGRTAGSRARHDLGLALDNVANHPNVGPFIARQLIQRLVSSNPTPAYIGRVAAVFADDNGTAAGGARGNLRAVVRAVLMDVEARDLAQAPAQAGKLREPLLRVSALWRALDARSRDGRIREGWPEYYGAQAVLRSPTVFNFYLPNYALPGEIATAGLVSPEFQITTDTYLTRLSNELGGKVFWAWFGNSGLGSWDPVQVDLTRDLVLADQPAALLDRYNLLFMGGTMSAGMRSTLLAHLNDIAPNSWEGWRRERVQDALWLILTSPEYVVER